MNKEKILERLSLFNLGTDGIGGWLGPNTDSRVFERLDHISDNPLSKVQLNQLLAFGHEAPVSDAFFNYYWLSSPNHHPWRIDEFKPTWNSATQIVSLDHLAWGIKRLFIDGLLYFGNVRTAFRMLRALNTQELKKFFDNKRFDTNAIKARGPSLPIVTIPKDNRYLIAEMACKSYDYKASEMPVLKAALLDAYRQHCKHKDGPITIKHLLDIETLPMKYKESQPELLFSADDVLNDAVDSENDLETKFESLMVKFINARTTALGNTDLYLSMVNDLDVYVATSMRTRNDFRQMANKCETIFSDQSLTPLNLRYFDPTLSAASGHEDKGIIECLMVKCAKALVYCAGENDSYGKDAEAAMALSLGKPVIFLCDQERRRRFYRDIHPLSRLIEFQTGIVVGAMVTDNIMDVPKLLLRIFENDMVYEIKQTHPGHLQLVETLTQSVVRLQSSDRMLTETFWNHYHNRNTV